MMDAKVFSHGCCASVRPGLAPNSFCRIYDAPESFSSSRGGRVQVLGRHGLRKAWHGITCGSTKRHVSRTACASDSFESSDPTPAGSSDLTRAKRRQVSMENLGAVLTGQPQEERLQYSETRADGKRFLEVTLSSMHNVDHGSILGLLCLPATRAGCLEFPLFLNHRAATAVRTAVERGGLPHALEALERLEDQDLKKIYVDGLDDETTGGEFLMEDERTGETRVVPSTFPQAMGVAIRYRQPLFIESSALVGANADFIHRMLLNPLAREEAGDAERLGDLAHRMQRVAEGADGLRAELALAVAEEKYADAVRLKGEVEDAVRESDVESLKVLRDLIDFYLQKMGIFFSL